MGLRLLSSSSYEEYKNREEGGYGSLPNPHPNNYTILRSDFVNGYLIIEIQYHDCINFEGRKIMVFKCESILELTKQKMIDPHFSDHSQLLSPIARFRPTEEGWGDAHIFVVNKQTKK